MPKPLFDDRTLFLDDFLDFASCRTNADDLAPQKAKLFARYLNIYDRLLTAITSQTYTIDAAGRAVIGTMEAAHKRAVRAVMDLAEREEVIPPTDGPEDGGQTKGTPKIVLN